MKIAIYGPEPPFTRGYNIRIDGKLIVNSNSGMFPHDFSEDEIEYILGESEYNRFEKGKCEFNIPKWKIDAITGRGFKDATREQNIFSCYYSGL